MRISNRSAHHQYKILDTVEAGIVLSGIEVKSLRAGRADLSNSYVRILNNEPYLVNAYIYPYLSQTRDYDPKKTRKLLLHRHQINNLIGKTSSKGKSLIPLSIYSKHNYFKVEVAIAQSKSKHDHRKTIKQKDEERKLEQDLKDW